MILISHRGNTNGKIEIQENEPTYIDSAIERGYDVEIDVWFIENILWLGHDKPQYRIDFIWIQERYTKLWVHCKNVEAVVFFKQCNYLINYFWHEEDTLTLTSHNHIWVYPSKQPIPNSIAVMPELNKEGVSQCLGICSDYIEIYKNENNI
jgi:hypothetical protein